MLQEMIALKKELLQGIRIKQETNSTEVASGRSENDTTINAGSGPGVIEMTERENKDNKATVW